MTGQRLIRSDRTTCARRVMLFLFALAAGQGCSSDPVGTVEEPRVETIPCGAPNQASLEGTWRRLAGYGISGSRGLIIRSDATTGTVTANPNETTAFVVGDVKWRNYNNVSCKVEDLVSNLQRSNMRYELVTVEFSPNARQIILGGAIYDRQ